MLLDSLLKTNAASGSTEKINELIKNELSDIADNMFTDNLGNLIVQIGDAKKPAVAIFAPADKPALTVTYVEENGCIRVHPLGSVDLRSYLYSRVTNGTLCGIFYPDSSGADNFSSTHVNFGFKDATEARSYISEGDTLFFETTPVSLQNSFVSGAGLSSVSLAYACYMTAKSAIKNNDKCFYFVFTSQDSLQHRSVCTAAFGANPEIAICLESYEGKEIALKVADKSFVADCKITENLAESAKSLDINLKKQVFAEENGYACRVQSSYIGIKTGAVLLPVSHLNSACETVNRSDIEAFYKLITHFLNNI